MTINCAGFPDSLLESELFGHVQGQFHRRPPRQARLARAGARRHHLHGRSRRDEPADAGAAAAVSRDRRNSARRRRSTAARVDVRVIAATHRRLLEQVADKTFREDLYYRLNVIHITVPPLRERREDIFVLLQHFLELAADADQTPIPQVTRSAMKHLMAYDWPGNVRELRNVAERVVARSQNGLVDVDQLPEEVVEPRESAVRDQALGTVDVLFQALVSHQASFWPRHSRALYGARSQPA